jgi:hypothetical protein
MPLVAFATHQKIPDVTPDDRRAAALLSERGITVRPAVWDDREVDWSRFDAVVVRSTWDYHLKPAAYSEWLRGFLQMKTCLWNLPSAILENMDKRYLVPLAERGIEVVPTVVHTASDGLELSAILRRQQWNDVVIKPAVSCGAWGAWRTSLANAARDQLRFAEQVRDRDVLIQPYLPEVATDGEWSLIFFRGHYSHAVLKKPGARDFRVQPHLGGTFAPATPAASLVEQAEAVLSASDHSLLYARVDGVNRNGRFVLMELEINEPFLFLGYSEEAAQRFADAIANSL